jgi:hypothetical protein
MKLLRRQGTPKKLPALQHDACAGRGTRMLAHHSKPANACRDAAPATTRHSDWHRCWRAATTAHTTMVVHLPPAASKAFKCPTASRDACQRQLRSLRHTTTQCTTRAAARHCPAVACLGASGHATLWSQHTLGGVCCCACRSQHDGAQRRPAHAWQAVSSAQH